MGTYSDGSLAVIDNAKLSFSAIPAKAGSQPVIVTAGEEHHRNGRSCLPSPDPASVVKNTSGHARKYETTQLCTA
ncbi:MAG: hypothetical protein ACLUHA_16145 [Bacteroides stercoris]